MAIIKISELPAATEPISGNSVLPVVNGSNVTVKATVQQVRQFISVKDYGAVGDGITNDTVAIQAAIDSLSSSGGVVYFPPGEYRIAQNVGVNDRWGVKITSSNIILEGSQASLRRFNTDISTFALAYPLIFVGTPDSNVAAQTQNITIKGLRFIGENTRHSTSGGALFDFRTAIVFKNTKATNVTQCFFSNIDSSVVWYEPIGTYDYANNIYYNTTKNYQSKISGCSFVAQSHSTPGRALLHCINADGIDGLVIDGNNFEWTDVCLSGESTYDTADQSETDTFTYSSPASRVALGAVKRQSRDIVFSNNTCLNCSEHPLYPAMVSVVISGNTITTDTPNICNTNPIQTRSRGVAISGNTIIGYPSAINISAPSSQVTFSGNTFYATDDFDAAGGAISIDASGLTSYVSGRSDYLTYLPMDDLVITGNIIVGPETYAPTSNEHQNGVRVYTGSVDSTNYPQGKIFNINITGNAFKYWQNGIYFIDNQYRNMVVSGNNFTAKPFTRAGFSGATTLTTRSVVQVYGASTDEAAYMTFTNNNVYGSTYLVASRTGAGPATTYYGPEQFSGNKLDYIKNTKTSDIRDFTVLTNFRGNTSLSYLDRTFTSSMIFNSLYSGSGSSELKYNMIFDGTNIRFYTDDAGTYITL